MVFNQGLWLVNVCGNATVVVLCGVECGGERLRVGLEKAHVGDNPTLEMWLENQGLGTWCQKGRGKWMPLFREGNW